MKYLIDITPQGTVSFISQLWGSRLSEKQGSGILILLLPGDVILADKSFNIYKLVSIHQADTKLPAFMKGKIQLSAKGVQEIHHSLTPQISPPHISVPPIPYHSPILYHIPALYSSWQWND